MSTKQIIGEQVLYRYYGGFIDTSGPIQLPDVYKALEQKINATFAMRQFNQTLPSGQTIPDNLSLATYEDIAVTSVGDKSKATLPVMPITLPRNAGINEIRPILNKEGEVRTYGIPVIPLQAGQNYLLQSDTLLNDLMGQFGYEPNGRTVLFTKDMTLFGITTVQMKLVVMDISQYSATDPLPIPADYEDQLIKELLMDFAPVTPESGIVNSYTTFGQNQSVKQ